MQSWKVWKSSVERNWNYCKRKWVNEEHNNSFSDLCYKITDFHMANSTCLWTQEKEDSNLKLKVMQSRNTYSFTTVFHAHVNGL